MNQMIVNELNRRLNYLICRNWVWDIIWNHGLNFPHCPRSNFGAFEAVIYHHFTGKSILRWTVTLNGNNCRSTHLLFSWASAMYGLLACVPVISLIGARREIINAVISGACAWSGHWTCGHCGFLLSLPGRLARVRLNILKTWYCSCHLLCRDLTYEWLNQILKVNWMALLKRLK